MEGTVTDYADTETLTACTSTYRAPRWRWYMYRHTDQFGQMSAMLSAPIPAEVARPGWLVRWFQRVLLGITWERIEG